MTTRNAEIVQAASNLHHSIRDAFFGEAQDLFDNAAAFDPGDRVLDYDTRTGEDRVDALLTDAGSSTANRGLRTIVQSGA